MPGLLDNIRGFLTPQPKTVPNPFDVQANAAVPIMGTSEILPDAVGRITGNNLAEFAAGFLSPSSWMKAPNKLDIFIGKGAKTWDQAKATEAAKRLYRNEDPAKVWAETGIGKAPWDRTLRAEIPDKNTYFSDKGMDGLFGENKFMRVSDAIDHPQLKKAYNMDNKAMLFEHNGVGNGSYGNGVVAVNADINDPYSVAAHELQHSIQHDEGWARGGSPNKVLGEARSMNIDPTEAYRRLAGEAEARLTQYRLPLSAEERLAQYPYDPEYFLKATGVPLDSLIVRYGAVGAGLLGSMFLLPREDMQ